MLTLPQATALGPLEHAIMRVVWAHASAITVRQVYKPLSHDHNLAYTTIMTTMVRLADKGLLTRTSRREEGNSTRGSAYDYTSAISRDDVLRSAVEQLLTHFGANPVERQRLAAAVQQGV